MPELSLSTAHEPPRRAGRVRQAASATTKPVGEPWSTDHPGTLTSSSGGTQQAGYEVGRPAGLLGSRRAAGLSLDRLQLV
jgi:hypothetical protein